jgi:hypothetical protein
MDGGVAQLRPVADQLGIEVQLSKAYSLRMRWQKP